MRAPVAAHVVVEDLSAPFLSRDDMHHLGSVLRLRSGEAVGATDGRGRYVACEWTGAAELRPVAEVEAEAPRAEPVCVGFVPVKGERPEWVVQKLTELGVDRIIVLRSERAVVRWDGDRAAAQVSKLERVARAAVMQSRQVWLPEVVGVFGPAEAMEGRSAVSLADLDGPPLGPDTTTVLIGPEGGWSEAERESLPRAGASVVGLGSTVLRAETAAIAAGVLLTALRDERVVAPRSIRPGGTP